MRIYEITMAELHSTQMAYVSRIRLTSLRLQYFCRILMSS